MGQLKVREAAAWTPAHVPNHWLSAAWQLDIKMVKAYVGTSWEIFWPPGASGGAAPTAVVSMASVSNPLNIFSTKFGGGDADSEVLFTLAGDVQRKINLGAAQDVGDWISNKTGLNGALYEIQAVLNSGTTSAGSDSTGIFLGLGVNRAWNVNQVGGGNGSKNVNLTVTVRKISAIAEAATIVVDLTATTEL